MAAALFRGATNFFANKRVLAAFRVFFFHPENRNLDFDVTGCCMNVSLFENAHRTRSRALIAFSQPNNANMGTHICFARIRKIARLIYFYQLSVKCLWTKIIHRDRLMQICEVITKCVYTYTRNILRERGF